MKKNKNIKFNIKDTNLNQKKTKIIIITCLSLFIVWTILVKIDVLDQLDKFIASFVIKIRSEKLTKIMINITNIARAYSLMAITLLIFIILKNKKNSILILLNLICAFILNQTLKFIFRRPRPDGLYLITQRGFSYPSGHAMVSMAYITLITYFICQNIKSNILKIILYIASSIVILLIGFSRIYLGVHHTTDVIGGFLLSITYLIIFISLISKKEETK